MVSYGWEVWNRNTPTKNRIIAQKETLMLFMGCPSNSNTTLLLGQSRSKKINGCTRYEQRFNITLRNRGGEVQNERGKLLTG